MPPSRTCRFVFPMRARGAWGTGNAGRGRRAAAFRPPSGAAAPLPARTLSPQHCGQALRLLAFGGEGETALHPPLLGGREPSRALLYYGALDGLVLREPSPDFGVGRRAAPPRSGAGIRGRSAGRGDGLRAGGLCGSDLRTGGLCGGGLCAGGFSPGDFCAFDGLCVADICAARICVARICTV